MFRLTAFLKKHYRYAYGDVRLRISDTRYRIPDVAAMDVKPGEILTDAPLVCIEIVSPNESFARLMQVSSEYLAIGVTDVYIIDPFKEKIFHVTEGAVVRPVARVVLTTKDVEIGAEELFTREE